jgi:ADP-ribose pyrophosphatase
MKILSSQKVFTSKFFHVNQVEIERDGNKFTKDIIEENPIAVVLPYTSNGEIYLISEFRDALEKVIFGLIGGKMKPGDDPLTSAKKELKEEAGLTAATWKHIVTWETSPVMKKKMAVFFATDLETGVQSLEEDEQIEPVKITLPEALAKIENGEIPVALDAAVILLYDKIQKEGKL